MTIKQSVIGFVVCLVMGIALGYSALPAKIVIKTQTVTVTQIVHDSQTVKKDNTITTITKKPDGTEITIVEDKNVTNTISETNSNQQIATSTDKETTYSKNNLNIGAIALLDFSTNHINYGAYINKSLLGPFTMGLQVTNNPSMGVMLGVNF